MYATALASTADWNDTRFKRPEFDAMLRAAAGELDQDKRKAIYRDVAVILRDEGGLILPMFNQYIDAVGDKVGGYGGGVNHELMDGYALAKCWLKA
jgi:peptide/nickel transport system substrate-binding protein